MRKMAIVQVNKVTGEIVGRWECAEEAAAELGMSKGAVYHLAKSKTLPSGFLCLRYEHLYDPHEKFGRVTENKPVVVYEETGGKLAVHSVQPSVRAVAKALYLDYTTVANAIAHGRRILRRYRMLRLPAMGMVDMEGRKL